MFPTVWESCFHPLFVFVGRMSKTDLREALGECAIAYADLDIGECVREGRRHKIFR